MPPKKGAKSNSHILAVKIPPETVIKDTANKKEFVLGSQFATGGFGCIYTCQEVASKRELVVKVEPAGNGPLFTEVNVFQRILKLEHLEAFKSARKIEWLGLPYLISNGIFEYKSEKLRYLVIPKYSESLESIRAREKKFEMRTTFVIALSVLNSLEYIHSKNFTHADVKAGNILLRQSGDYSSLVLVDFGLARMSSNNEDKPDKKRAHNGTAIFTSIDAHRGCHPSFRGDIEILAYNMIYWLIGTLPWMDFESSPDKIYIAKKEFMEDVTLSLKTHLQDHPKSITLLRDIFNVTLETQYSKQVDFCRLQKIIGGALRKRTLDEDTKDTKLIDSKISAVKKKRQVNTRNNLIESIEDIDESVEQKDKEILHIPKTRQRVARTCTIKTQDNSKEQSVSTKLKESTLRRRNNQGDQYLSEEINKENGTETPKKDAKAHSGRSVKISSGYKKSPIIPGCLNFPETSKQRYKGKPLQKKKHKIVVD